MEADEVKVHITCYFVIRERARFRSKRIVNVSLICVCSACMCSCINSKCKCSQSVSDMSVILM